MLKVLLVLVGVMAVLGCVCVCVVAGFLHALAVRNRVAPGRRSLAPLGWLVSPGLAARLHRRLRIASDAADTAVSAGADGLGLADLVDKLRECAFGLDAQLVLASRAPQAARGRMLAELSSEVVEVEQVAERVIRLSRLAGTPGADSALVAMRERLDLLESALWELDGMEVRPPAAAPRPRRLQA